MLSIENEVWWNDEKRNGIAIIEPKHLYILEISIT
jgi:hypothetical protein